MVHMWVVTFLSFRYANTRLDGWIEYDYATTDDSELFTELDESSIPVSRIW